MATTETPPPGDLPFVEEQIAEARAAATTTSRRSARARLLRPVLWRLHFLGGLLAAPILLSLVVTGILFAWSPQFDALRFGDLMERSSGPAVPLSQQVAAAQDARPDWPVTSIVPAHDVPAGPDVTTAVILDPPGGGEADDGVAVFVDETTGTARGEVPLADMSAPVLRGLHSSWTLGAGAEPLTELAASWFLISLVTGLYLWWPGLRRRGASAFAVRRGIGGRRQSKDWHNFLALALLVPMALLAVTGLTWTEGAGERYDDAKAALSPPPPGGVDPAPPSTSGAGAGIAAIDRVSATASAAGLQTPVRFEVPPDDSTAWTVRSEDALFPVQRDQLAVDGASGAVLERFDYADESWLNKLTTGGILFHQAELFGLGTQVLMTILALGIGAMIAFGYRMWWLRRPANGWGAPPPLRGWLKQAPLTLLVLVVVLAWVLPTLAIALAVWLVLERTWTWWRAGAAARGGRPLPELLPRPGWEACKAAGVAVLGIAMIAGPHVGDGDPDLGALGRLVAWAWSVPLGIAFLTAGLVGLWAMFAVGGRGGAAPSGATS